VDISDPIASGTSRGCYIIKELGESEKDVLGDVAPNIGRKDAKVLCSMK
jgi:hypothetical protein